MPHPSRYDLSMGQPSETAVKALFTNSRNLCFFTRCEERLTDPKWKQAAGEVAYIKGEHPGSARYDTGQSEQDRHGYDNLMVLCPKHHKLVDRQRPDDYPPDVLTEMRARGLSHF